MGDVCRPFYYDALGLERVASKRRALRVFFSFPRCPDISYNQRTLMFNENQHKVITPFGIRLQKQQQFCFVFLAYLNFKGHTFFSIF